MEMKQTASEESNLITRDDEISKRPDERGCSTCCKFPSSVFFIIVNEFCERFYYYGMRAVLVLYLTHQVGLVNSDAMALFHSWVALSYLTPLAGGILADSYFGKYNIILWLSIVYMIGAIVMSVTAIPGPNLAGPIIGLLLVAVGCGGIKACTSAFGGDQIVEDKLKLQESFFSVFYFAINSGSVLSSIITPYLRADVHCLGQITCFPLAFGFPAILMLLAIIVFVSGKSRYIIKPATESVVLRSFQCCCHGFRMYLKERKAVPKKSWIDHANDKYDQSFINDIKIVGRILLLFVPILVFWSLFDQQSSQWVLQGSLMDGQISKSLRILPDQMVAVNPILILLFIPLFESFFYPLVEFLRIPNKPLRRMSTGMVLSATAFLVSYFVQLKIESDLSKVPPAGLANLGLVSLAPGCSLEAISPTSDKLVTYGAFNASALTLLPAGSGLMFNLALQCKGDGAPIKKSVSLTLTQKKNFELYGWKEGTELHHRLLENAMHKDKSGQALVRAVYKANAGITEGIMLHYTEGATFLIKGGNSTNGLIVTPYTSVKPDYYSVSIRRYGSNVSMLLGTLDLKNGAAMTLLPHEDSQGAWTFHEVKEVKGNTVNILVQIPQYVLITAAEILVSITGLSYSYTQAPQSMKSTVSALWLVTVGIGNLLVVLIAEIVKLPKQSDILLVFSILAYVTSLLFAIDAYFYIPNDARPESPETEKDRTEKEPQ